MFFIVVISLVSRWIWCRGGMPRTNRAVSGTRCAGNRGWSEGAAGSPSLIVIIHSCKNMNPGLKMHLLGGFSALFLHATRQIDRQPTLCGSVTRQWCCTPHHPKHPEARYDLNILLQAAINTLQSGSQELLERHTLPEGTIEHKLLSKVGPSPRDLLLKSSQSIGSADFFFFWSGPLEK